jgi:hypothetical protein
MCLRDLELLLVDWILHLEVDFVLEVFGQAQVIFDNAESILVFVQDVQVSFLEFLRYLQMATSLYLFRG